MKEILSNIKSRFISHSITVNVADSITMELYNNDLILTTKNITELLSKDYDAASIDDEIERLKIFDFFNKNISRFDDIHTRKAVYQPKYEGDLSLAACLSAIQAIVRHDKLDLHVLIRSQNFDKNFLYDMQTFAKVADHLSKKLHVEIGEAYIHITSLHKIIKSL